MRILYTGSWASQARLLNFMLQTYCNIYASFPLNFNYYSFNRLITLSMRFEFETHIPKKKKTQKKITENNSMSHQPSLYLVNDSIAFRAK